MCGRFFIDKNTIMQILKMVDIYDPSILDLNFEEDVLPTTSSPIITIKDSKLVLINKTWGYPNFDNRGVIINARAETVLDKQIFRVGVFKNRIVIPATHFYEWNQIKEKYTFSKSDGEILFFAGILDNFNGEDKFVILTTKANSSIENIHDRMPLILKKDQIKEWIMNENSIEKILSQVPTDLNAHSEIQQQTMF